MKGGQYFRRGNHPNSDRSTFDSAFGRCSIAVGWEPEYSTYCEGQAQIVETWEADGTLAELRHGGEADEGVRRAAAENTA